MKSRIRVLEITATLKPAGAEHVVVSLASTLDPDRFEVAVVSLFDAFPLGLEPILNEKKIPVWHLGKHSGPDPRMYPLLRKMVNTFRPDIIHTHCYVTRYTFHLRASGAVHTMHNVASLETDAAGRLINRYVFNHGVVPVAVGAAVSDSVRQVYRVDPVCIPNGIDTGRFRPNGERSLWRKKNGFREEDVLVVSVARLDPQKNPGALVRAINTIPEAELVLVGEGELRKQLEGHPRVHLLGIRHDIPEILAASDIFALASNWEGLPLAVIEALAAGLPVLGTSVGCLPEVVQHGRTGLLVDPGNQPALVDALSYLIRNPNERRSMGKAARNRAESYGVEAMVSRYEQLFSELLEQKLVVHA